MHLCPPGRHIGIDGWPLILSIELKCFVCPHVSIRGFQIRKCLTVRTPRKKSPWPRQYQFYISNWYINRKVFTSRGAFAKRKTDKNFTRIDWCAYHSTKVRLATFIWCNGWATCGMPVNSGGIFISFPLGKCASWIIFCRNALHHLKGLKIGFHRRFLFFLLWS